ncbi:MAG: phosphatidic acid phosphatase, partial [Saprospiraceae bacterium]
VSAACATVLTKVIGEPFQFIDSTEMEFGMQPRTFNSFFEASDQSAMSRLFAGIHYRRGNEAGRASGREIGAFVAENVKTK